MAIYAILGKVLPEAIALLCRGWAFFCWFVHCFFKYFSRLPYIYLFVLGKD